MPYNNYPLNLIERVFDTETAEKCSDIKDISPSVDYCLSQLSSSKRIVLMMRYKKNMKNGDIAKELHSKTFYVTRVITEGCNDLKEINLLNGIMHYGIQGYIDTMIESGLKSKVNKIEIGINRLLQETLKDKEGKEWKT